MIFLPIPILLMAVLVLGLPVLALLLTLDVVSFAAAKLGLSAPAGLLVFYLILLGSLINFPLYRRQVTVLTPLIPPNPWLAHYWGFPLSRTTQETVIALNLGGGLIPVLLAFYQFFQASPLAILLVTAGVSLVSYYAARVVPGIGIQMDALTAPLTAALLAFLIAPSHAAPVAFAGGVLGTLIGADLLHLPDLEHMGAGVLSIGGAGVFDGIALCGLVALLLT